MSESSLDDVEVHINAWVKQYGTERGFIKNNFNRYGYGNESGLRRWLKRNRSRKKLPIKEDLPKPRGPVEKESRPSRDISKLTDIEIIRTKYGDIEPTLDVSTLNNDDWIDKYITYDYYTYDPDAIIELKKEWRTQYLSDLRTKIWILEELLALLPRGYGKTESVLALFVRWFLEIREPLYIVAPAYNHNKNLLRRIVMQLKSPAIRRKYGDIIDKISYDKEMLTLTYHPITNYISFDPPLSMVTWGGAKEGPHPAWIHFEDVMQKEYKNIESNEDIKHKYTKTFAKMRTRRGGKRTKVTATGTRYGMVDFYSYLMTEQEIPVYHKEALPHGGEMLLCPNYTLDDLVKEQKKDPASFSTAMNNRPTPSSGLYFKKDEWISGNYNLDHEQGVQYIMVLDPARGFSDFADNSAMLKIAIFQGSLYVMDGFVGKIDDDDKIKKFDKFYSDCFPTWSLVEETFAQIDMKKFQHIRGIVPYSDTTKNAKLIRISALKPYFYDGLIKVKEGIQPYDFLYNEYLSYNETQSTPNRKDDAIDALSIVVQQFGHFLEKYTKTDVDWSGVDSFHLKKQ